MMNNEKIEVDLSENYSNLNQSKRVKLISGYFFLIGKSSSETNEGPSSTADQAKHAQERKIFVNLYSKAVKLDEFERAVLSIKSPDFEEKDSLIEILVRYSILYLEEFKYEQKLVGLKLIDHLAANVSHSQLNANLRSKLLIETLDRYLHDKESHPFLDHILGTMCVCLNIFESRSASQQHYFKKHSQVLDSILSNCYMTSDLHVKLIYYDHLKAYVNQMGNYACRHLEKMLTICFECSEHLKVGFDFATKQALLSKSIDTLQVIVQQLHLRIHSHSKRIINFLIKLIYFATCSPKTSDSDNSDGYRENLAKRMVQIVEDLFKIPRVKELYWEDFQMLVNTTTKNELNQPFYTLINHIC